MRIRPKILTFGTSALLANILMLLYTQAAAAHVKWFCAFDVAGQPRGLENILCPDFEQLTMLTIMLLVGASLVEGTRVGQALLRALGRILDPVENHSERLIRAVCAFFFVALWTTGGLLLTPELKTALPFIPWLQLAIAFGMIWRRTLMLSGLGIVTLFGIAVHDYGTFHLMDYPVFLGIAAYLALIGSGRRPFGIRPLDLLRWTASITLMWASIEKWAYPEWTFPLFVSHPEVAMGFDREFFMRAAGMVEFGLSFGLIWTPLCRRCSALVLTGMFVSAILEFGKIDAIGHAPIIVVMLAIAADSGVPALRRRPALWAPVGFAGALGSFLLVYYVMHSALFGTTIV